MRPDQLPERQLDPEWPGDATPEEIEEQRRDVYRHISNEILSEFLGEAPLDVLTKTYVHCVLPLTVDSPVYDDCEFGRIMRQYIQSRLRDYADQ